MKNLLFIMLCLAIIPLNPAYSRGFEGGGRGFAGGYHGGFNGGFHDNGIQAGWHDHYWNGTYNTGVIVAAPISGYYGPACQNTQTCNSYGQCWTEQNCD